MLRLNTKVLIWFVTPPSLKSFSISILWLVKLIMLGIRKLAKASLRKTNAHGLARPVVEKQLYIRVMWLIIWLLMCCLFIWYFVGFVKKLHAKDVTTIIKSEYLEFEYPDLYFCYHNMISGSRHLNLSKESIEFVGSSFKNSLNWCRESREKTGKDVCDHARMVVQMNSLPYSFLADNMAHIQEQAIQNPHKGRTNGLSFSSTTLIVTEFYHPTHLRCFKVSVNKTDVDEARFTGQNDFLKMILWLDAPIFRKDKFFSEQLVLKKNGRNFFAPHWSFDDFDYYFDLKDPKVILYITQPMYYPNTLDKKLIIEAGKKYNVRLEIVEHVHKEDSNQCMDMHPDVQVVNPYDNSPYTVKYDYAICFYTALQAQFRREFNATCPFLPHPWPPAERSLYNLSSGWGSVLDVESYMKSFSNLRQEEPLEKCAAKHPCTQRLYKPIVQSMLWPTREEIEDLLTNVFNHQFGPESPALSHLKKLWDNRANNSQQLEQYVISNFLELHLSASKSRVDQVIFTNTYDFGSFVADVGGILGICLGMSLLTAFELAQFLHDVAVLLLCSTTQNIQGEAGETSQKNSDEANKNIISVDATVGTVDVKM